METEEQDPEEKDIKFEVIMIDDTLKQEAKFENNITIMEGLAKKAKCDNIESFGSNVKII